MLTEARRTLLSKRHQGYWRLNRSKSFNWMLYAAAMKAGETLA